MASKAVELAERELATAHETGHKAHASMQARTKTGQEFVTSVVEVTKGSGPEEALKQLMSNKFPELYAEVNAWVQAVTETKRMSYFV